MLSFEEYQQQKAEIAAKAEYEAYLEVQRMAELRKAWGEKRAARLATPEGQAEDKAWKDEWARKATIEKWTTRIILVAFVVGAVWLLNLLPASTWSIPVSIVSH